MLCISRLGTSVAEVHVGELSFDSVRLGSVVWELSFGILRLGTFALDLSLGSFRLRVSTWGHSFGTLCGLSRQNDEWKSCKPGPKTPQI